MVFQKGSNLGLLKEVSILNKGMRMPEGPGESIGVKNKVLKKKKKCKGEMHVQRIQEPT